MMSHRDARTATWSIPTAHALACLAIAILALPAGAAPPPAVVKKFQATEENLANPGQGWMTTRRLPGGESRFPYSVAYFRLSWQELEPEENQYNWKPIDEAIEAWTKRDARVALRIMATSAHSAGYYTSPKWLFDAGCRSFEYEVGGDDPTAGGKRIKRVEPDYGDPLFLSTHARFIAALAKRYDGHPQFEFLDIGSYGVWGEWHTKHGQAWPVRKQIIDMYLNGFHKTPLVSMSDDAEALAYAIGRGAGIRRDGVGSPWHEANWIGSKKYAAVKGFADQWKRAPVVFEWYGDYDYFKRRNWPFDKAIEFMLANHVTMINDNVGRVPAEEMPKLERLARLAGYRFVLRQATHPATLAPGKKFTVDMQWSNVGVGKLYRRYDLELSLLDSAGKVVASQRQKNVDPTTWLPGNLRTQASLGVPADLPSGTYSVGVALVDQATGKPAIALAIDAPQTDRRYRISSVSVP